MHITYGQWFCVHQCYVIKICHYWYCSKYSSPFWLIKYHIYIYSFIWILTNMLTSHNIPGTALDMGQGKQMTEPIVYFYDLLSNEKIYVNMCCEILSCLMIYCIWQIAGGKNKELQKNFRKDFPSTVRDMS